MICEPDAAKLRTISELESKMNRRKHLGPVYETYPARELGEFLGDKLFKAVATVICWALWTGVYYILIGVVNFNRKNFLADAKEMSTSQLLQTEGSLWTLLGCYFVIMILVFRSRIGEKTVIRKRVAK